MTSPESDPRTNPAANTASALPGANSQTLSLRDAALAIAVMAVWGSNFTVIHLGLDHFPPLLFATLRFTIAVLPAIFFVKPPDAPWSKIIGYGVLMGAGMFGLLFWAMRSDISPGLASLVAQTQVFFTIAMAVAWNRERVEPFQIAAVLLAACGIAVIAGHADGTTTVFGLTLVILAAVCWAGSNMVTRSLPGINMVSFIVWASIFSALPLFAMSLAVEGWPAISNAVANAPASAWAAALYQGFGNVLFGFAAWGWLLARYPAATVAPTSLLVPVFGMAVAALWVGEDLPPWKLGAAALVMSGLALNMLWPRFAAIRGSRVPPPS